MPVESVASPGIHVARSGIPVRSVAARIWPIASLLLALCLPGVAQAIPDHAVRLDASISTNFPASPTENTSLPDLRDGSNTVVGVGPLEQTFVSDSFHETYVGVGESGTSQFETEFRGSASINSGALRVEVLAKDLNNASAASWTTRGAATYTETLTLSGPVDADGNITYGFTTHLGSLDVENMQPAGFDFWWRGVGTTSLVVDPLAEGFAPLNLSTIATLTEDCPTVSAPPCFGFLKRTSASGEIKVPASNPVVQLTHQLSVTARSAHSDASQTAFLEIELPEGGSFTSSSGLFLTEPVPEPGSALLLLLGLAGVARLRARQWSTGSSRGG